MKIIEVCIAALLAAMVFSSVSLAASASMFSAPILSTSNIGFGQISPSEIGKTPIIFAPTEKNLFGNIGNVGGHMKPMLMTGNWTSSMKTSPVNQMFSLLASGIGKKTTTT